MGFTLLGYVVIGVGCWAMYRHLNKKIDHINGDNPKDITPEEKEIADKNSNKV